MIELVGAPGAGKTTLLPTVLRACEAAGLHVYTVVGAARAFALRTTPGRLAAHLSPTLRRRGLWLIFLIYSASGAMHVARAHPGLVWHVLQTQWRRPQEADVADRRVLYWYLRTAGAYQFLRTWARPDEALVIDEGFVHRAVQLHASSVERPDVAQVARYVATIPWPDLLVVVTAPPDVCRHRVHARGVWRRLQHRGTDDIDRFVANAHLAIELAVDALRLGGQPIVAIDNTGAVADAEVELKGHLDELLRRPGDATHHDRWRYPFIRLPRVSHLTEKAAARRRSAVISSSACDAVLQQYGVTATSHPENIPFGRRNQNVIMSTAAGPKVLRRYRSTAQLSSVQHEHSLLIELERRHFPAVRLSRTPRGDTIVSHGDQLHALFDFEYGKNLSSFRILNPAARASVLETAGRTLAHLHCELADFTPATAHHLGYRSGSDERMHDLRWYLEALETLPSRDPAAGPRGRQHHYALSARAADVASLLAELQNALEPASLPRAMIHGDYGVHNLLFRRDGLAVVTDFELARREWRLVDLVIVLSRIPRNDGRAFLRGYRQKAAIPAPEWRHLPDVWQYYLLTGAVQSWHNHFVHGGEQRLTTAHDRLEQAQRAREKMASQWT